MNKLAHLIRFIQFHYCSGISWDTFLTIVSRKRWSERHKKVFLYNVSIGVLTSAVHSLVNNSTYGQKLLDELYDSIMVADFLGSATRTELACPRCCRLGPTPGGWSRMEPVFSAPVSFGCWTGAILIP